jgi:hypothetical protein
VEVADVLYAQVSTSSTSIRGSVCSSGPSFAR